MAELRKEDMRIAYLHTTHFMASEWPWRLLLVFRLSGLNRRNHGKRF